MSILKYYLKKPRGEIVRDIFSWLLVGGSVMIAASSPYFLPNIMKALNRRGRYKKQSVSNAFYRLKKQGYVYIQKRNHQIFISLTPEGKQRAGSFQVNDLQIAQPKRWDGKWRVVIFDIAELGRIRRDGFRGFLLGLGFYQLQQSVWVHPYECRDEIRLLRDFFGLTTKEVRLLVLETMENDVFLRKKFAL